MQSELYLSEPNFEPFMNYLKSHLENYPEGTEQREIILLVFALAYKKRPYQAIIFQNWHLYCHSKRYTPKEAFLLCENFVRNELQYDLHIKPNFVEAIAVLENRFPKIQSLI